MARSQLILDRYRVIDQAGTVVHAFDTHLKRDVAIKCIELSEDEVARARLVALEARMAADLEDAADVADAAASAEVGSGADGAPASDGFPADPAFLRGVDERRQGRGTARSFAGARGTAADEVPPWEEVPAAAPVSGGFGADDPAALTRWDADAAARAGVARPALGGRPAPRKTRHAPEFSQPFVEVQDAAPISDYVDESAVDVRHLRGIRASRTIDGGS